MPNQRNIAILLVVILVAGFIYRFTLTIINTYPPGADIGLHESVINSILAPKTTLLYNYYHMGGGVSATNPGYHIFAAFIISMTGAPDYLVQAAVASMFSALIILAAFILTRLVWGTRAGLVAAILVAFSASDILMLSWAGYPNIVALALIPIIFYFLLQPAKLAQANYLIVTTIITAALFLTHVFSGMVFLATILFALLAGLALRRFTDFTFKNATTWLIPIFFGIILVSPYLLSVLPLYFGAEGAITGTVSAMQQAVVETRLIPATLLGLSMIPMLLFLVFSKSKNGRFFTLPSILFVSTMLVPLVASQAYLLGFFLDYERFLYFLATPAIICVGLILVYASNIIENALKKMKPQISSHTKTAFLSILVITCLGTSLIGSSLFMLPDEAVENAKYFQVMNPTQYEAIQWIKTNTPADAVCVADANFGWWLSGFAQRPTLSAVDPQFLILQREFAPAQAASNLMRADYLMDNGILQIEQAGAYANGSSHDIYAEFENSIFKPLVFSLNDSQVSILYRDAGNPKEVKLESFSQSNTQVANDGDSTSFIISRWGSGLRVTEEITIFKGQRFAEVTFVFQNEGSFSFDWLQVPFQSRGKLVQYANSIGLVDNITHWINQIVLPENKLGNDVQLQETPNTYQLICNLAGGSNVKFSFYIGLCPYSPNTDLPQEQYYESLIENNTRTYLDTVSDAAINCFDYKAAIKQFNISYVVIRDFNILPRFQDDPTYELAFKNSEVAIYKVVGF